MHRLNIYLTEDLYQRLRDLAQERGCSVSRLVRDALAARYPSPNTRERRLVAVKQILEMNVPAPDWPQMEEEIIRGYLMDDEHLPPSLRLESNPHPPQDEG